MFTALISRVKIHYTVETSWDHTNMTTVFLLRKQQDVGVKAVLSQVKDNQDSQIWIFTIVTETSRLQWDEKKKTVLKSRSVKTAGTAASEMQCLIFSFSKCPSYVFGERCALKEATAATREAGLGHHCFQLEVRDPSDREDGPAGKHRAAKGILLGPPTTGIDQNQKQQHADSTAQLRTTQEAQDQTLHAAPWVLEFGLRSLTLRSKLAGLHLLSVTTPRVQNSIAQRLTQRTRMNQLKQAKKE